jgi:hypothetical protein
MRRHGTADGTLGGGRLSVEHYHWWPVSHVLHAEFVISLGRDLTAAVRDPVLRLASRCGVDKVRVSPMSPTWLETHEIEYDKHRENP